MSLPPSDWAEDTLDLKTSPVEWENPEWSGLSALLATLRRVLMQPKSFFTNLPLSGGLGEPLGFSLLVGTMGVLSSLLWHLVMDGDFSEAFPAMVLSKHLGNFIQDPKVVVGIFMLTPFLVVFGQFFFSFCLLGAVRLTGPENTRFEGIFRLVAYSQASALLCFIPWGGAFMAAVWNFVLLIIGLSKKFNFSIFKAVFTLFLAAVFEGLLLLLGLLLSGTLGLWGLFFS